MTERGDEPRSPFSPPSVPPPARPDWSRATRAIAGGRPARSPDAPLNQPAVFASAYQAGGPVAYARDGNPTWTAFEDVLGDLEGGIAVAFASGMAATAAVLDQVPIGGAIVVPRDGYYGTRAFLDAAVAGRWEMRLVDIADTDATLDTCDGAQLLWIESPTNPLLDVADIPTLAGAAQALGLVVAVDNTLMTPLGQRPLELGADLVVHSATKLLAGHSDVLLGAVVAREGTGQCDTFRQRRSLAGAVPGTMEAYLALRGVRTLPLRLERASANAHELARRLAEHSGIERVRFPGLPTDPGHQRARAQMNSFGTLLAFEVFGGASAAEAVARSTRLIVHATSLGGIETTIERRAKWPGEAAPPALLRLSVGCEDVEDLWSDVASALTIAAAVRRADASHVELKAPHASESTDQAL
jgi:cystathionine gamma-synthase